MKPPRRSSGLLIAAAAMAASLALPMISRAQGTTNVPATQNQMTQMDARQAVGQIEERSLGDPHEVKAYNKFHAEKNLDKKIKLGNDFVNKYPNGVHLETVYEELAQAYYDNHDLADFYTCADEGIAKFPKDPTLRAVAGATMARAYNHADPDADKKLEKAEKYEKESLELLKTMKTPEGMSDEQLAAYQKQVSTTAHSGLGLIYFRQGKFDESVTELQQATQNAATPDATDYLVLGGDYQNLSQFKEAADAFNRCAQIQGPLQAGCKQYADSSLKQAANAK